MSVVAEPTQTQPNSGHSIKSEANVTTPQGSSTSNNATSTSKQKRHSVWRFLGFRERYEFVPWSICSTFMILFLLRNGPYLHPSTFKANAIPGEWYWFGLNPYYLGIFLHLYATLPAGALAIVQFIPAIRNKAPYIHTYIGYVIMTLLTLGNIGIIIISPRSLGGNDLSHMTANYFLIFSTSISMFLAWYYIKLQQIDKHRQWMLRAMFWMGVIVTMRLVMIFLVIAVSINGKFATLWTCDEVLSVLGDMDSLYNQFPSCRLGLQTYVGVPADLKSDLHIGSLTRLTFSPSSWIAVILHTVGVELYIYFTPKEAERLAKISRRKQLALGLLPAQPAFNGITKH